MQHADVETKDINVHTKHLCVDVTIPTEHDMKVSSRAYRLVSTSSMNLSEGIDLPDWLMESITAQIKAGTLSLEEAFSNLNDLIRQIETGVNQQIIALQTEDESNHSLITTNVSRLDNDMAAVLDITNTKVTADEASALTTGILTAQFNTPNSDADAWFLSQSSVMSNSISSTASQLTTLYSTYNNLDLRLVSTENVLTDVSGWSANASKLITASDGSITGWGFADGSNIQSEFMIKAQNFNISDGVTGYTPFSIAGGDISFDGLVSFANVQDTEDILFDGMAAADINANTTTISGGKITTASLNANKIAANTIWARGLIASSEFANNTGGAIGGGNPAGFQINGNIGTGSYSYPNIYGAYIRGGTIYGTTINSVTMNTVTLNSATINTGVLNTAVLNAPSINGMKFKMGTFITVHDNNYDINIDSHEGRLYNTGGGYTTIGGTSASFNGLLSVVISSVGPNLIPTTSPAPAILSRTTFRWDRDDVYPGTQIFSYVAWGY